MSLLQQPQIKGIGPTTLGNPFSQFVAPTAPDPVVPNITPRKPPVDLSQGATMAPMPVAKPTLPQGIPEPKLQPTYAHVPGDNKDQFGQSQTPGEFDPNNLIKDIGSTGKGIKNTMNEVGDFFQNKAPGLETAKQNNKFLTQDHLTNKITTAIQSMPDATDEEIAQAIGQLKNEGYIFEGMNDKNFNNPVTNFLGKTPLGEGADLMGGFAKMGGNFVGGTLEGGAQISEGVADIMGGDTNKGASKVVAGGTNYGLNLLGGMFPGVSSVFNTEAVKPVVENTLGVLNEGIKDNIVNKGLDLTGMDPNSEEYKNYSEAGSNVLTLLTTLGLAKTGQVAFRETFGTDLNYNNATVKDFVKSTGKTADDLADAIKAKNPEFNTNISDSTPISKIFTPEEYAHIEALARQNGSSGVGRREGLISDATQAKIKDKVTNGFKMAEKRTKEPTPISDENAINSQGIKGTVPEPTVITNIKDKVFGDSKDIDLANRAVSPRNVKGKTMTDKMQGGKVALAGIQQLHDDSIAGNITADIGTLEGGIAGIEEARQYHGKIIGENANQDQKIAVSDIGQTLKEDLQNPIMVISGPIKGIGDDLVQMLDHPSYQDGVNMKDVQTTLSTISNRIRNSPELRNSLQSEPAGQAVSAFIDELSARYEKAIEEGGNGSADREARIAYAKIKKIQDDLLNSGMVNARNTRTGQSGFVGKSIATYELLTHGVSGIPVALAMKYLGETKGEYATRGGAYAKLIRNMDRRAVQRTKGVYNTGDSSKYTPPAPKTAKPTPKPKKDAGTTGNNSGVPTDTVDMAGAEGKPIPRSDIPGSTRTKIEVPRNPKGNISNKLAGNKGVIVPKNPNMIEDTSKILPSGDRMHKEEVKQVERDLNSSLKSNNMANKPQGAREFIDRAMNDGKITKEDAIAMVEKLYEKADGFQKPGYEKLLNDLFANKKSESFDDILNEKKESKPTISPRQEYLDSPKGMYEKFRKMSADGRYNHNTTDAFMEKFKEKTGFDLMNDGDPVFDKDGQIVKGEKYRTAEDMNNTQLTTKILKGLGDRETVSKEFIRNMTNSGDVKQIEKDIIRGLLESEGEKINVAEFKVKVESELLPLKVVSKKERLKRDPNAEDYFADPNKYEYVNLPTELRGNVKDYRENIYESPIETSAGSVHFSGQTKNYFGHTRVEDMAPDSYKEGEFAPAPGTKGTTRRVIEVQSDLFQKGNLEKEGKFSRDLQRNPEYFNARPEDVQKATRDFARLSQYNDPTAHFRMIREEISQAAKDGIQKLQFPTGETAMKIEGLVGTDTRVWSVVDEDYRVGGNLFDQPQGMKRGQEIVQEATGDTWIITEVLGDGKFKAVPKHYINDIIDNASDGVVTVGEAIRGIQLDMPRVEESFDISGKADTNNPIYKFYEKEVGRYLKNKYDAKLVTDDKGVSWYQVDVKDSMGGPVEAFRKTDITPKVTPKMTPEQKIELQELNKKFFGDDSIQIVDKIDSNAEALGSYKGGMIKIVEGQGKPLDTLHHEAVHKYLDVFATEKEAKAILEYGKEKYKDSDYASVEEKIAEDFIKYAKDRLGFVGSIRKLFDSIIDRIKQFFGNGDKIQKMYRDIMGGKAKKVDLGIKPKDEKFREDDQAWKTSNTHPDNPIKYKIEETKGEKSIVIDVWPKENIKGKGITKSVLLDLLKDSYSKGVTTIQPSYGMWTTQGWGFMENLQNAGFIKAGKKIGGIETFDIMDSIKNRETENKLGRTDITPKIKPRK